MPGRGLDKLARDAHSIHMRELLLVRRLHLPHQKLEARGLLLCTAAAQPLQHRLTLHVGEARGRARGAEAAAAASQHGGKSDCIGADEGSAEEGSW